MVEQKYYFYYPLHAKVVPINGELWVVGSSPAFPLKMAYEVPILLVILVLSSDKKDKVQILSITSRLKFNKKDKNKNINKTERK